MAALAASAVTVNASYDSWGVGGRRYVVYELTLTLTSQGTVANPINASVLNLSKVKGASVATNSDNTVIIPAGPSYDNSLLLLGGGASNAPADYTGTFIVTVWGDPTTITL